MTDLVVHEAEIHRQHVRLKIPVRVEIQGEQYTVEDWSLGGIGVDDQPPRLRTGDVVPVALILPFEDFDLTLRLDAEMVYSLPERPRFGMRFKSMTRGQIALFRNVIDRYLTGEIASPGDVLTAVGREMTFQRVPATSGTGSTIGRIAGWLVALLVGAGLVGWIGYEVYLRHFGVTVVEARVETPVSRIRAPVGGWLQRLPDMPVVQPGTVFARITPADGVPVDIVAPCICTVGQWKATDQGFVAPGDTVALLVSAEVPLKVRALIPAEQASRILPGSAAQITLPGDATARTGTVELIEQALPLDALADGDMAPRLVPVLIRPDQPLSFELLGTRVDVRLR